MVPLVRQGLQAQLVLLEHSAPRVPLVQRVRLEPLERQGRQAPLGLRVPHLLLLDLLALLVRLVVLGLQALRVLAVPLVSLDLLGLPALPVPLALLALTPLSLVRLGLLALLDLLAPEVLPPQSLGRPDHKVLLARLVPLVRAVRHRRLLVLRARRVQLVLLVRRETLALTQR